MSVVSFVRRRVWGKASPLIKRVLLPTLIFLFVLHAIIGRTSSPTPNDALNNLVVPGEALDPLMQEKIHLPTHHHHQPQAQPHVQPHVQTQAQPKPNIPKPAASTKSSPQKKVVEGKKDEGGAKDSSWSMYKANITDSNKVRYKGHAITEKTVTLTLMSSADKVFMSLNKKEIYRNLAERGIHVVTLDESSGKVVARRVFDTFNNGTEEEMVEFIDDVKDGRILVFAVLDEASKGLSWRGRNKLRELGSRWSEKLGYRDMWALVARKGGLKLAETYSNVATADTGYAWGGPVFLRTDFDLVEKKECGWPVNERNEARRVFCAAHDGYGAMCDCDVKEWKDVFFHTDDELHNRLASKPLYKDIGVAIMATNRPYYLFRTLKSLWEAPGVNRDLIAVYADSYEREMTAVCKLFGVHMVVSKPLQNNTIINIRNKVQRIFRDLMMAKFPEGTVPEGNLPEDSVPPFSSSSVLILEHDIEVAVDIFKYLHEVAPVMERDPTVLGISAFNFYSYRDVSYNVTQLYRTNEVNNLALYVTSQVVHQHVAPRWVEVESKREWFRALSQSIKSMEGGALLYPEVSRARHRGYQGFLVKGQAQKDLFSNHIITLTTDYNFDSYEIDRLELTRYNTWLEGLLKESKPISFDFCKHDFNYAKNPVVQFVNYDGTKQNEENWKHIMTCLRTWDVYPEAGWRGVWQFHYHGHHLSIVATPLSPYSYLKPANYTFVTPEPTTSTTTTTTTTTPKSS